jgi:hypothetical protein
VTRDPFCRFAGLTPDVFQEAVQGFLRDFEKELVARDADQTVASRGQGQAISIMTPSRVIRSTSLISAAWLALVVGRLPGDRHR